MSQVLVVLLASPAAPPPRPQPAPASLDDVLKLVSNLVAGMADVQERLARIEAAVEKGGGDRCGEIGRRSGPGAETGDRPVSPRSGPGLRPGAEAAVEKGGGDRDRGIKLVTSLPPSRQVPPEDAGGTDGEGEAGPSRGGGGGGGSGSCSGRSGRSGGSEPLLAAVSRVNATAAELEQRMHAASDADDFDAAEKFHGEMAGFTRAAEALQRLTAQWARWESAKEAAKAAKNFAAAKAANREMEALDAWTAGLDAECTPDQLLAAMKTLPGLVNVASDGTVREPASGAFDVTVAPGQAVQAAVDACPAGGSVLLLPGTHKGPLVLTAGKVVHVFGRGLATLHAATGTVVTSESATSTLDGLIIRRLAGDTINKQCDCVWIKGGRLRLQACDVTSAASSVVCVVIDSAADPVLSACKCERAWDLSFF